MPQTVTPYDHLLYNKQHLTQINSGHPTIAMDSVNIPRQKEIKIPGLPVKLKR